MVSDEVSFKRYLLSLPREYAAYRVHISNDPAVWGVHPLHRVNDAARRLGEMVQAEFPGIEVCFSGVSAVYMAKGSDAEVMEQLTDWLVEHMVEALHEL